jgi:hypothetical protein
MKPIALTISKIDLLNRINSKLTQEQILTKNERLYLLNFLSQLPTTQELLKNHIPTEGPIVIKTWETEKLEHTLQSWKILLDNIPGYDYVSCWFVQQGERELLMQNIVMTLSFAPSMSYNHSNINPIWLYFKDDGTANFNFEKLENVEEYPELYNFKGTWKEAYYLLIETLKKGWPMEEFPEELLPLLKK